MSKPFIPLIILSSLVVMSVGAIAQTSPTPPPSVDIQEIFSLSRAKNLARQAAEQANGGLNQYRAESSMHGDATSSPFTDNSDGTWTFKFYGNAPGEPTPSVESVITVAKDGTWVRVDYNGPIR